ncbi:MAG: hypothetical protein Q7S57_05395 [bacterium]|nr:hypothetical protein [bacterium]
MSVSIIYLSSSLIFMKKYRKWFDHLAIIVLGMGDLDAYLFDWDELADVQKGDFLKTHLSQLNDRFIKKDENWQTTWKPFALLGFSIPPSIIGDFENGVMKYDPTHADGVLLINTETDGVFYCGSDNPDKLAIIMPKIKKMKIHESVMEEKFPVSNINFDYKINTSESSGAVLDEIDSLMKMSGLPGVQFV